MFLISDMSDTAFEIAGLEVLGNGLSFLLLRTGLRMITLFCSRIRCFPSPAFVHLSAHYYLVPGGARGGVASLTVARESFIMAVNGG